MRWTARTPGGDAIEDRAAALFRQADPGPAAQPPAFGRVRAALAAPARPAGRTWARAAALLVAGASASLAAAGAVQVALHRLTWRASTVVLPSRPVPPRPVVRSRVEPETAAPEPAPRSSRSRTATSKARPALVAETATAEVDARPSTSLGLNGVEPESALALESRALTHALTQLRAEHNPAAALASLDALTQQFPRGALAHETEVARVDALLALDRRGEALGMLDAMEQRQFAGLPRTSELRLLRGELLGSSGRCTEALPIFDASLAQQLPRALEERALFGRASCRGTLHDVGGSRSDLERYLSDFPQGRFAAAARKALDR